MSLETVGRNPMTYRYNLNHQSTDPTDRCFPILGENKLLWNTNYIYTKNVHIFQNPF